MVDKHQVKAWSQVSPALCCLSVKSFWLIFSTRSNWRHGFILFFLPYQSTIHLELIFLCVYDVRQEPRLNFFIRESSIGPMLCTIINLVAVFMWLCFWICCSFHWSICLSSDKFHVVLITTVLLTISRVSSPALFLLYKIALSISNKLEGK